MENETLDRAEDRFCTTCGGPIGWGVAYCTSCGTPIAVQTGHPAGLRSGVPVTPPPPIGRQKAPFFSRALAAILDGALNWPGLAAWVFAIGFKNLQWGSFALGQVKGGLVWGVYPVWDVSGTVFSFKFLFERVEWADSIIALRVSVLLSIVNLLYGLFKDGLPGGQSIGKMIAGIRVVHRTTGRPCTVWRAALRALPYVVVGLSWHWIPWTLHFLTWVFLAIEVVLILTTRQGLRIGDFVAGTQVVHDPPRARR